MTVRVQWFDKLQLVLAIGLVQGTDSALTHSTGSELAQIDSPPPSPPSEPPSPPSQPPFQCPDLTLKTKGWQMISFNCAGTYISYRTLNDIMKGVPFEADDQILLRDRIDGLVFATYTGTRFVGGLVKRGLSFDKGYKVLFSGAVDSVINQTGFPTPYRYVPWPKLYKGWNYLGVCLSVSLTHQPSP